MFTWFASLKRFSSELLQKAQKWIIAKTKPANSSQLLGTTADLLRSKTELVAENALLRQQLIILKRSVKQPKLTSRDRWLMVLLSSKLAPCWLQSPPTVIFCLFIPLAHTHDGKRALVYFVANTPDHHALETL